MKRELKILLQSPFHTEKPSFLSFFLTDVRPARCPGARGWGGYQEPGPTPWVQGCSPNALLDVMWGGGERVIRQTAELSGQGLIAFSLLRSLAADVLYGPVMRTLPKPEFKLTHRPKWCHLACNSGPAGTG